MRFLTTALSLTVLCLLGAACSRLPAGAPVRRRPWSRHPLRGTPRAGAPLGVFADLQGPKIRVGDLPNDKMTTRYGADYRLVEATRRIFRART